MLKGMLVPEDPNSKNQPAPVPDEVIDGEPVFQVFVLGTRASGKTVFLASMFHAFKVQRREVAFYITTDEQKTAQLNNVFQQIANPQAEWPPGDYSVTDYEFRCFHSTGGKNIPLFRFKYFDFPGGYVDGSIPPDSTFSVRDYAKRSHAILVLIDGEKVLNFLENGSSDGSLYSDIEALMPIVQECIGKPIHFMITKSDLFDNTKHSFQQIKETLLSHPFFADVVEQQKIIAPVHLVPVSAIGANFAAYDPQAHAMRKLPKGVIVPINVDLSIGLTLFDQLNMLAERGKPKEKGLMGRLSAKLFVVDLFDRGMKSTAFETVTGFLSYQFGFPGIIRVLETASKRVSQATVDLKSQIEDLYATIVDHRSALKAILEIQVMRVEEFQRKFPELNLGGRAAGDQK